MIETLVQEHIRQISCEAQEAFGKGSVEFAGFCTLFVSKLSNVDYRSEAFDECLDYICKISAKTEPLILVNRRYVGGFIQEGKIPPEIGYFIFLLKWFSLLTDRKVTPDFVSFCNSFSRLLIDKFRGEQQDLPAIEEIS